MKLKGIALAFAAAGLGLAPLAHAAGEAERIAQLEKQLKLMQEQIEALKSTKASTREVADLKDQVAAQGKESVVAGDIPGSFRIPGSDTSIRLYGVAELNYVKEFKGDNTASDYSTSLNYAPVRGTALARRTGESYLHARTSRIGVEAAMPTPYGQLGAKVEGDFNNNRGGSNGSALGEPGAAAGWTNGYQFRLRHAYVTLGPWLAGQTWSTFMDLDNTPETVDFNGPLGNTTIRQAMLRYTYQTPQYGNFIAALENPASYVLAPSTGYNYTRTEGSSTTVPDLVLRWDKPFSWGALSLAANTHEHRLDNGSGTDASKRGWGLRASGQIKTVGDDFFSWVATGGKGIGRYLSGLEGSGYDAANDRIVLESAWGLTLGYQHKASDSLRFNAVYGHLRSIDNGYHDWARANGLASAFTHPSDGQFALNGRLDQFHLNAIWNPVKQMDVGAEYIWGRRETIAGEKGDMSRVNFMVRYNLN